MSKGPHGGLKRCRLLAHVVTPVLENWINVDEADASHTHPSKNELSYSAVTPGMELLKHPVVEQLAMTGIRLAILD